MEHIDPKWISSVGLLVCAAISETSLVSLAKCSVVPLSTLLPSLLTDSPGIYLSITVAVGVAMYLFFNAYTATARVRRMSFMTDTIVGGPFPDSVRAPDPIIGTVLYFEKLPPLDAIKKALRAFVKYERFNSYPKKFLFSYKWTKPAHLDYDKHFIKVRTHNEQQLHKYLDETMMKKIRLGDEAPQWEVHVISNTRGKSAVLLRISHIIGDGVSFVHLTDQIFKDKNGQPLKMEAPIKRSAKVHRGLRGASPVEMVAQAIKLLKSSFQSLVDVLQLPMSKFDSKTAFTAREPGDFVFTTHRHAVMFPILNLASVKAIKEAANVTVNDVMMTAMAGCLRKYCTVRADSSINDPNLQTRALVPVAFGRPPKELKDDQTALRNKWCLVSANFHANEPDTKKRLLLICQTMNTLKTSPVAPITMWFQDNVLHHLPRFVAQKASYDTFSRHSMVFSNVPGPQQAMYFAEEQLISIQVLYPNLLPQVIALSYNGGIFMNIVVDPEAVTHSDDLPTFFIEELVALARAYGLKLTAADMLLSEIDVAKEADEADAPEVMASSSEEAPAKKSWKDAAGRRGGSSGYQIGDLGRIALRSMTKKKSPSVSKISEDSAQLLK